MAEIRSEPVALQQAGEVIVQAQASAISRGTERLVWSGKIPASEYSRMRAPFQAGDFPYPVKYGYAFVGKLLDASGNPTDRRVFALHPHQTLASLPDEALTDIPETVPDARACLAANMETALNAVWDAKVTAGETIAVIGGGIVGCLTAYLCGRFPGTRVTLVDVDPERTTIAESLGVEFSKPESCPRDCDNVFHASGHPSGLQTAIDAAGFEATITELSWYGTASVDVLLGGAFHAKRLNLQSSQVGSVSPRQRGRWSYARRLMTALQLLDNPALDALLAPAIDFYDLPRHLPAIFDRNGPALCPIVRYPD
ncbi:MAG: zinc-binding alcohol dehydrogenase [Pseudomonadota bacterium]